MESTHEKNYQYDIFLSYASEDKIFAEKLAKRLFDEEIKVWFDKWIMQDNYIGIQGFVVKWKKR